MQKSFSFASKTKKELLLSDECPRKRCDNVGIIPFTAAVSKLHMGLLWDKTGIFSNDDTRLLFRSKKVGIQDIVGMLAVMVRDYIALKSNM